MIKVKLDMSLSFWQMIASWISFESKRYIKKWLKIRDPWIGSIHIGYSDDWLKAHVIWKPACMLNQVRNYHFTIARGISMRDLWDNLLNQISEIENMRNVDELKIWLDTQVV